MKIKIVTSILLAICLTFAATVTIVNQCETEGATKKETASFDDDYLYMGKSLDFSGETDDLIFLGESLDFSGKTRSGIIGGGKELLISGTSENGVIIGGENIAIDGDITGSNFIGCRNLLISDSASITGDLFAGCGKISIDGTVEGNVYIGAGKATINNEINGDVTVYAGRLKITENGRINGNLTYSTKEKPTEEELSRVSGEVTYEKHKDFEDSFDSPKEFFAAMKIIFHFLFIVSFLVIGSILLFLPVFKKIETQRTQRTFWFTALWGLIPILMYPAVIVLCFATVIPIPLAFILILAFIPLFFIAYIIGTTMAGQYIVMKFKWRVQKRHYHFFIGSLAAAILSIIPVIDFFTVLLLSSLGWGVYISFLFNRSLVADESAQTETTETK